MFALTDEESDAMEMSFPVYLHELCDKVWAGTLTGAEKAVVEFEIPSSGGLPTVDSDFRYSPTLAGAIVDALPYLVDFPYGCTEQR